MGDTVDDEASAAYLAEWANAAVYEHMQGMPSLAGMGSTLAGVAVVDDVAVVFNVGDARVYVEADGYLVQLSIDDSGSGGALTQCLGGLSSYRAVQAHVTTEAVAGQRFILASDGLFGHLGEQLLEACLVDDDEETARNLLEAALDSGGPDNVSIAVVRCPGGDRSATPATPDRPPNEREDRRRDLLTALARPRAGGRAPGSPSPRSTTHGAGGSRCGRRRRRGVVADPGLARPLLPVRRPGRRRRGRGQPVPGREPPDRPPVPDEALQHGHPAAGGGLRKIQSIDSAHVVKLHGFGIVPETQQWCEVQEFVEGGDLLSLMRPPGPAGPATQTGRRPPIPVDPAGPLFPAVVAELSEAIAAFHRAGLAHHDVKPTNILIRSRQPLDLVLADFGLSIAADRTVFLSRRAGRSPTTRPSPGVRGRAAPSGTTGP